MLLPLSLQLRMRLGRLSTGCWRRWGGCWAPAAGLPGASGPQSLATSVMMHEDGLGGPAQATCSFREWLGHSSQPAQGPHSGDAGLDPCLG